MTCFMFHCMFYFTCDRSLKRGVIPAAGQGCGGDSGPCSVASPAVKVHRASLVRVPARPRLRAGSRLSRLRRLRRAPILPGQPGRLLPGKVSPLQHLSLRSSATRHASVDQCASWLSATHVLLLIRAASLSVQTHHLPICIYIL